MGSDDPDSGTNTLGDRPAGADGDRSADADDGRVASEARAGSRLGPACRRRPLLAAVGAAAGGLAGCSRITSYTYEADPVLVPADVQSSLGLSESVRRAVTRSFERDVEGMQVDVTVTSHVAVYEATDGGPWPGATAGVGVLATPAAKLMGRSLNPLVGMALQDLLTDPRGEAVLRGAGIADGRGGLADGGAMTWRRGPTALATDASDSSPAMLGTEPVLRSFGGVVGSGASPAAAFVHAARAIPAADVVLAAAVHRHPVSATAGPYVGPDGFVPAATVADARGRTHEVLAGLVVEG